MNSIAVNYWLNDTILGTDIREIFEKEEKFYFYSDKQIIF